MITASPRLVRAVRDLVEVSTRAGHLGRLDSRGAEALRAEVLDRFAQGDYQGGLGAVLGRTSSRRGREAVRDVAESALLSLGVDVTQAKSSWKRALLSLGEGGSTLGPDRLISLRASPIRDVFRGLSFPLDAGTRTTIRLHAAAQARLEASLRAALAAPDRTAALVALEARLELHEAPDNVLMGMLTAHREDEQWASVVKLYEAAPDGFRALLVARREYALALNQLGRTRESRDVLKAMVAEGDTSSVTLGLQGRVLKDRFDRAKAEGDPRAPQFLDGAIRAYRGGLRADPAEHYPGVALPPLLLELGTPAAKKEARAVAEVLLYNAERRASFGEQLYWDAATALEASAVLGDGERLSRWLDASMRAAAEPWMRVSTAKNLERLVRVLGQDAPDELRAAAQTLRDNGAVPVRRARGSRPASVARPEAPEERERVLAALLEKSYRVGGRSPKWLSGNYAYAGIAHDVRVTPSDVTYFDRVMRAAALDQVKDPLAASAAMDTLIRDHFGTDALEDLQSPEHQYYDRVMPGLARLMAATRENSQTNVSADWINGLADCRQHAPAKLMLWQAWKRAQTNELLTGMLRALERGDRPRADELRGRLDALTPWELRIVDAEIVDRSTGAIREEHTLTVLVQRGRDAAGTLAYAEQVRLADSFYQHVYPLGDGALQASFDPQHGLTLEVAAPAADGAPITLVPTAYSRDRAAQSLDFGQLAFRGQTVATPGWELDVPVAGLDLQKLHDAVDAEVLARSSQASSSPP